MEMFKRFEANTQGRDLVIGDLHGCFHILAEALTKIHFDPNKDRLFSLGDLVNRGPFSNHILKWLEYPWFHAIRGNHEEIAQGAMLGRDDYGLKCGDWLSTLSQSDLYELFNKIDQMPFAFEVKLRNGNKVGMVHADMMHTSWNQFLNDLAASSVRSQLADNCVWSRARIKLVRKIGYAVPVEGVQTVYLGHSVVEDIVLSGNVAFIDTGCVYGEHLTMVDINTGKHIKTAYHPA